MRPGLLITKEQRDGAGDRASRVGGLVSDTPAARLARVAAFDQPAVDECRAGPDEGDEVGCVSGDLVDAPVVHPRRMHVHRTRGSHHLPRLGTAIAYHWAVP